MSRLRDLVLSVKEEDPAKTLTVSVPSSLVNWIEKIMTDTGLGRSTVVKALLQDGLIEYLNSPLREYRSKLSADCDDPEFQGYVIPSDIPFEFGFEPEFEPAIDVNRVFDAIESKMEQNKKAVMG